MNTIQSCLNRILCFLGLRNTSTATCGSGCAKSCSTESGSSTYVDNSNRLDVGKVADALKERQFDSRVVVPQTQDTTKHMDTAEFRILKEKFHKAKTHAAPRTTVARPPHYNPRPVTFAPAPATVVYETHNDNTMNDVAAMLLIDSMMHRHDHTCTQVAAPSPVYEYEAPAPVYYSPPPAPAYEPPASSPSSYSSSSYDSSSYSSSSSDYSSSSYDSGSSSSGGDW